MRRRQAALTNLAAEQMQTTSDRRTRRELQEDEALLTLGTLLHALVGSLLTIECRDETTARGTLDSADNLMKCASH